MPHVSPLVAAMVLCCTACREAAPPKRIPPPPSHHVVQRLPPPELAPAITPLPDAAPTETIETLLREPGRPASDDDPPREEPVSEMPPHEEPASTTAPQPPTSPEHATTKPVAERVPEDVDPFAHLPEIPELTGDRTKDVAAMVAALEKLAAAWKQNGRFLEVLRTRGATTDSASLRRIRAENEAIQKRLDLVHERLDALRERR